MRTSVPNSERGAALLEAALALGLVAMVATAGLAAFSRAAAVGVGAEAKMAALADAENALERASAAGFLARALAEGEAVLEGDGWRVTGAPYRPEEEAEAAREAGLEPGRESPLALVRLVAEAGGGGAPLVVLETLRVSPR